MIRAVMTDFGGVLVRTGSDQSRRNLERRIGLAPNTVEEIVFAGDVSLRAQSGEVAEAMIWETLARDLNLNEVGLTGQQFRDEFFADDFLDEELISFIRSLRPAYKTGLISNAWSNLRAVLRDTFRIDDAFDSIVVSAEEKVMKPDERIYRIALDRLRVKPYEAIFLDDLQINVDAANALGMQAVHFKSSEQARRDIRALLNGAETSAVFKTSEV